MVLTELCMLCRHSDGEEERPVRKLDMGPATHQDRASPPLTPRSLHAESEHGGEEEEPATAAVVKKRTGEEELLTTVPADEDTVLNTEESIAEALSDGECFLQYVPAQLHALVCALCSAFRTTCGNPQCHT